MQALGQKLYLKFYPNVRQNIEIKLFICSVTKWAKPRLFKIPLEINS